MASIITQSTLRMLVFSRLAKYNLLSVPPEIFQIGKILVIIYRFFIYLFQFNCCCLFVSGGFFLCFVFCGFFFFWGGGGGREESGSHSSHVPLYHKYNLLVKRLLTASQA